MFRLALTGCREAFRTPIKTASGSSCCHRTQRSQEQYYIGNARANWKARFCSHFCGQSLERRHVANEKPGSLKARPMFSLLDVNNCRIDIYAGPTGGVTNEKRSDLEPGARRDCWR